MVELHPSIRDIPMPDRIKRLSIDHRGFPVPWFVEIVNGQPDHRIIDSRLFTPALKHKLCWTCGQPLGRHFAFLIGPMCAITRTISEPPSHLECCEYTVRACPFLSRPHAHRRTAGMPENVKDAAGFGIKRNPGVTCIWSTKIFKPFRSDNGLLFRLGDPEKLSWWAEGRPATPEEVHSSVYSGLPILIETARADARAGAEAALFQAVSAASRLFPAVAV